MEVFRAPRVSLIARPEFLEPEHLRVQWQGSASAGERLAEFAGRICYMSQHNPANRSTADYLENIKKQGHGSVLEHAVYVLLIEGISRSCSHELVRHRAGFGYSQLSQRYVDESHAAFVVPPAMLGDPALEAEWEREVADAQAAYVRAVEALMQRYAWIADKVHRRKVAREAARSVLPNATEVKIVVSGNARAWRTMLELRSSEGAELEIRRMAIACLRVLQREAPALFADFEIYLEIGEEGRRLALQDAKTCDRHSPDLELRALARAQLEHRAPRPRVPRHDDLHLGGVGKDAARRLARHLAPVHLVRDPRVALHQRLHGAHVGRLGVRYLPFPLRLERRVAQHGRRHHERGVRLVDVALRQLGVAEPGTMSHQLVRAGARDALDQQHVDRVLQYRAMALLLDILEVVGRRPVGRVVLAHVADPAGELGEALSGGGATLPLHPEVLGFQELRPGDERDARGAEDFHKSEVLGVRGLGAWGCQVQLWCRPAGRPLHLSQPGGNVIGNRGRLRADLEIGKGAPFSGGIKTPGLGVQRGP